MMIYSALIPERNKSGARDIRTIKGVKYYVEWIIQNNRPTHADFFFEILVFLPISFIYYSLREPSRVRIYYLLGKYVSADN